MIDTVRGPIHKSQLGVALGHEHMKWKTMSLMQTPCILIKGIRKRKFLPIGMTQSTAFPGLRFLLGRERILNNSPLYDHF